MNGSVKKARFICKAYKKSANVVIGKTDKVENFKKHQIIVPNIYDTVKQSIAKQTQDKTKETEKWEVVKPKFSVSEEQKLMEQVRQAQAEAKLKNVINQNTQKYEIPKQTIEEEHSDVEYKYEILSYGYVADTIITDIKEKAINLYCKFDSSSNFAFRLYINGNLIPYKEIRNTLGVTQKHIFKYYKSY